MTLFFSLPIWKNFEPTRDLRRRRDKTEHGTSNSRFGEEFVHEINKWTAIYDPWCSPARQRTTAGHRLRVSSELAR